MGVKDSTCTTAVMGETGHYTIYLGHLIKPVKYWIRLLNMDPSSLVKKAYKISLCCTECGYVTWISEVYNILETYGLEHYIDTESVLEREIITI